MATPLFPAVLALVAVLLWPGRPWPGRAWPAAPRLGPAVTEANTGRAPSSALSASRLVHRLKRRHSPLSPASVAEVVELVAAPLSAGSSPADAMAIAASVIAPSSPLRSVLDDVAGAAAEGGPLGPVWSAHAQRSGVPELAYLARAWTLTEELGAPLSASAAGVAQVLREKEVAQRRLAAATAGPRASMALLALLPLSGPAVGALLGVGPTELYRGPAGVSAAVGLGLVGLGWWWCRWLLRRALRPEVHS